MRFDRLFLFLGVLATVVSGTLPFASTDVHAEDESGVQVKVTVLEASNEGNDFDFDNDAYRDELVKLFSYTAYRQLDTRLLLLPRGQRSKLDLTEGFELLLTYQGLDLNRFQIQAVIRKGTESFVDTVVSIEKPGIVCLGGAPTGKGVLVIVLETGF